MMRYVLLWALVMYIIKIRDDMDQMEKPHGSLHEYMKMN